jgi:hypothetical protein
MTVSWTPSVAALCAAKDHPIDGDYPEDLDGGTRTPDDQREDNFCGKLAEACASEYLRHIGLPHDWDADESDVTGADINLYGLAVDVKMRYGDRRADPDLILTLDRQKADLYVQVDFHKTETCWEARIIGWITHDEAEQVWSPFKFGAKDKRLVPRDALHPVGSLVTRIVPLANTAQDGQTANLP